MQTIELIISFEFVNSQTLKFSTFFNLLNVQYHNFSRLKKLKIKFYFSTYDMNNYFYSGVFGIANFESKV